MLSRFLRCRNEHDIAEPCLTPSSLFVLIDFMGILDHSAMARHLDAAIALAPAKTLDHMQYGDRRCRLLAIAALAEQLVARLRLAGLQDERTASPASEPGLPFNRR